MDYDESMTFRCPVGAASPRRRPGSPSAAWPLVALLAPLAFVVSMGCESPDAATRARVDQLEARVSQLEQRLASLDAGSSRHDMSDGLDASAPAVTAPPVVTGSLHEG